MHKQTCLELFLSCVFTNLWKAREHDSSCFVRPFSGVGLLQRLVNGDVHNSWVESQKTTAVRHYLAGSVERNGDNGRFPSPGHLERSTLELLHFSISASRSLWKDKNGNTLFKQSDALLENFSLTPSVHPLQSNMAFDHGKNE